jgi:hypothetical protein
MKWIWQMYKRTISAMAITIFCLSNMAHAENAACWGDKSRDDITCVNITENLLLSLRGQDMESVRNAMNAPGVRRQPHSLHFISNYSKGRNTGSGTVNVFFEAGRAYIVGASVDSAGSAEGLTFVWNAYAAPPLGKEFDHSTQNFGRQPYCSDFSNRPARCSTRDIDHELTLFQMQSGLTKSELREILKVSCNLGPEIVVHDTAGDCARLRDILR